MKFFKGFFIISILLTTACLNSQESFSTLDFNVSTTPEISQDANVETISITNGSTLTISPAQRKQLYLKANLSDGTNTHGMTKNYTSPFTNTQTNIIWYSDNTSIVGISTSGKLTGRLPGTTTVLATLFNKTSMITVTVTGSESSTDTEEEIADNGDDDEITEEDINDDVVVSDQDQLLSLTITQNTSLWETGDVGILTCRLQFEDAGTFNNVSDSFVMGEETKYINWVSSDESVVTITSGRAYFVGYGTAIILAEYEGHYDRLNITVKMTSETAADSSDYFLNTNDVLTENLGANSGFGYGDFPNILYGAPVSTSDVLSLGYGGDITIELNDYLIVDGFGPDFTIFENPFSGWEECGSVEVSEDGITYYEFECDQYDADGDGIYNNCAGKDPVNYGLSDSDYLDPSLSGGDVFDLGDLSTPVSTVKYIKITDIGLCGPTADVPSATSAGFDMDALAIINGMNEF